MCWSVGCELAAVEANRSDSSPVALDSDVASLDVALADSGLALAPRALDAVGAEVVRLEFHLRSTIKLVRSWDRSFFSENES